MQPNTTKTRYYQLTAAEFNWEVSEGKTIKAWDLITAFRIPF